MRAAMRRGMPDVPRYTHFWNLELLLSMLDTWPRDDSPLRLRDRLIVTLASNVMLRESDMVRLLCPCEQEIASNTLSIWHGKTFNPLTEMDDVDQVQFAPSPDRPGCCLAQALQRYMQWRGRQGPREVPYLLLSVDGLRQPLKPATVRHVLQRAMQAAGVDTERFKPHSCRGALAMWWRAHGVADEEIQRRGRWRSAHACYAHALHGTGHLWERQ